jgi:hypothetical protein
LAANPSAPGGEQQQTDQDRCKFLMENVNATILSLNTEGEVTASSHCTRVYSSAPQNGVGNFEAVMNYATKGRLADTWKLLRRRFADWANEGH